jgi:hypothetical protein
LRIEGSWRGNNRGARNVDASGAAYVSLKSLCELIMHSSPVFEQNDHSKFPELVDRIGSRGLRCSHQISGLIVVRDRSRVDYRGLARYREAYRFSKITSHTLEKRVVHRDIEVL